MGLFFGSIIFELLLVAIAIYGYFIYSFKYWSRRGVFNPPPKFPFGNLKDSILAKEPHVHFIEKLYKKLRLKGLKLGGYYAFTIPELLVVDPDLIKAIMSGDFKCFCNRPIDINTKNEPISDHLFTQKGQKWRTMRKKLTPNFTSGKIKMMFPIFEACAGKLGEILDDEGDFDAQSLLEGFTIDIIGSCALGLDCDSLGNTGAEFQRLLKKISCKTKFRAITRIMIRYALKIFNFFKMKYIDEEISGFFMKVVSDTIEYRLKNNIQRNDFLQLLINMKNEEQDKNVQLNLEEIVAQCFIFFQAGTDTSSSSTSFFLYEMCLHPDIQDKVREEINEMLERHNGKLTYDGIMELPYLEMALSGKFTIKCPFVQLQKSICLIESMRLHTVVPIMERRCTEDYKVPNTNIIIKKGIRTLIPVSGLHSDPQYYPEPEKYDPERFNKKETAKRHPFTFMPFGEGPRVCIGKRFGLLQNKIAIVTFMKSRRLTLSEKMQGPLRINLKSTNIPKVDGGIWIKAERLS